MRRRARRWAARVVVTLALVAALGAAVAALSRSLRTLEFARAHRRESFASAQERVFGRAFSESIRRIRATTPPDATLYLLDETPQPSGAPYFALHYLAPRRLVYLGAPRDESRRLIRSRLPREAEWVVVVSGEGLPLELLDADALRPGRRRRGR